MRYRPNEYIGCGIYDGDDSEIRNHQEKLVKCRKQHICGGCGKQIMPGDTALLETGFEPDLGPVSCYTCIPCIDDWLDTIHQKCATCSHNRGNACPFDYAQCFDFPEKPLYAEQNIQEDTPIA